MVEVTETRIRSLFSKLPKHLQSPSVPSPFLDLTGDWGWADRKLLVLSLLDHSISSLKVVDIKGRVQESLWLEFKTEGFMPSGTWAWDSLEGRRRRSRNSGPGEGCIQHSPLLLFSKFGSDCLGPRSLWWPGLGSG